MEDKPKIELSKEQASQIAEDIEMSMQVFYSYKTKEVITLMPEEHSMEEDLETWEQINNNPDDYFEFYEMSSRESFRVMKEFAEQVEDEKFKSELLNALEKHRPFRNFKAVVEDSDEYGDKFYAFRRQKMEEWVEEQVNDHNEEWED